MRKPLAETAYGFKPFEAEAYWTTSPTVFADGDPMNLWVSLVGVMNFISPDLEHKGRKCMQSCDNWMTFMQKHGLGHQHAQSSKKGAAASFIRSLTAQKNGDARNTGAEA